MRNSTRFQIASGFMILAFLAMYGMTMAGINKNISVIVASLFLIIALYFKLSCLWAIWFDGIIITLDIDPQ